MSSQRGGPDEVKVPVQAQPTPPAVAAPAVSGEPAGKLAVSRVYDDELRAEQAAQALRVWARAQRGLGVAPVAVMARKVSGATTYHLLRIAQPRRAAVYGLLTGLVLFALPAAGAAGLAAWALGSIVFGLAGLIGVVPSSQVGTMVFVASLGAALLAALLSGSIGVMLGAGIGALVGLIDSAARGFSGSERSRFWSGITPGTAAVVARTSAAAAPLVDGELARLGGQPAAVGASPDARKPTDADTRIARTT